MLPLLLYFNLGYRVILNAPLTTNYHHNEIYEVFYIKIKHIETNEKMFSLSK